MTIFGSYIDKSRSLTGEALYIVLLDTVVALMAGLIIFPACFAFGVNPGSGPGLVFVTLPNVFNSMPWRTAAGACPVLRLHELSRPSPRSSPCLENIVSYCMDVLGLDPQKSRPRSTALLMFLLSLPCTLGFNVLSGFQPFGEGSIRCSIWKTSSSAITCCPSAPCSSSPSAATDGAGAGTISSPKPIGAGSPLPPLAQAVSPVHPALRAGLSFHSGVCRQVYEVRGKKFGSGTPFAPPPHQSKVFEGR